MGTNDQQQGGQLKDILNTKSAPNSSVTTLRKAKLDDATVGK